MTTPPPILDFFVDIDDVEYVCRVLEAEDGTVTDIELCELLEDGKTGEPASVPEESPIWEQAQARYEDWAWAEPIRFFDA
jgi:hypothetical protein